MNTAALTRPTLTLLLFALFCTGLLSGVYLLSKERIAHNEQQQLNQRIQSLLPAGRYDNNPLEDWITLSEKTPGRSPLTIYRARLGQEPVAAVITFSTSAGYNGTIRLIASLNADQSIAGVRVVSHRETPGLGDRIETEKDDWILGFSGTSLQNLPPEQWTVKKEGGYFDQFSGATITPRAVVLAVKTLLLWSQLNWEMVFAENQDHPVDSRPSEDHTKRPSVY